MKTFVVYFKSSCQISPDDWKVYKVYNGMKQFNENTTLKEVSEWASEQTQNETMPQITVNEV
jgi:hypothetical protein